MCVCVCVCEGSEKLIDWSDMDFILILELQLHHKIWNRNITKG